MSEDEPDQALEKLLTDGLAVTADLEQNVLRGLRAVLPRRAEPVQVRSRWANPATLAIAASVLIAMSIALFALVMNRQGTTQQTEKAGDGDGKPKGAETAPEAEIVFDSSLPFTVMVYERNECTLIGRTPTANWKGLRIRGGCVWGVLVPEPLPEAQALAREIQEVSIPGVDFSDFENVPLAHIQALKECPGLRNLLGLPVDGKVLAELPRFKNLRWLAIRLNPEVTDADLEALRECTQLERLRITAKAPSKISNTGLSKLSALLNLHNLIIECPNLSDEVLEMAGKLAKLKSLCVKSQKIGDEGLKHLAKLADLESLELPASKITEKGLMVLKHLKPRFLRFGEYEGVDPETGSALVPNAVFDQFPWTQIASPQAQEDANAADAWILALGNEDYEKRAQAERGLIAMGLKVRRRLAERLTALEASNSSDPQVCHGLRLAVQAIDKAAERQPLYAAEPKEGLSNRAWVKEKLKRRISFEFVDIPFEECLRRISKELGVRIFLDEKVQAAPPISLRVTDMSSDLALEWLMRLADLDHTIKGRAILVEQKGPHPEPGANWELPVGPMEKPWTLEETKALAAFLETCPIRSDQNALQITWSTIVVTQEETKEAGKLFTRNGQDLDSLKAYCRPFGEAEGLSPLPVEPAWLQALEKRLDQKNNWVFEELSLEDVFERAKVEVLLDKGAVDAGAAQYVLSLEGERMSVRELLVQVCAQAKLTISYRKQKLYLATSHQWEEDSISPVVLDLRPALQAGAAMKELEQRLQALYLEAKTPIPPVILRGRWLGMLDPWSERRAVAVLREAAKTGKVPQPPPAPWFFQTRGTR